MEKIKTIMIFLKDFVKAHLKLILSILAIIAVAIIVYKAVVGSPKRPVENLIKAIDSGDLSKIEKYIDKKGLYVFADGCEGNYKKFDKEYKKFKSTDDYEDYLDNFDKVVDELEDELNDAKATASINRIVSVDKVTKKLYKVKVRLDVDSKYDDEDTWTISLFVMKSGFSYKIVGADSDTLEEIF